MDSNQAQGIAPGKLLRDCTEAEQLERLNQAKEIVRKTLQGWDGFFTAEPSRWEGRTS